MKVITKLTAAAVGAGVVIRQVSRGRCQRLAQVQDVIGAETVDYTADNVAAERRERTGGRGPEGYRKFKAKEDGCVRAVFRPRG
jgi:threonine dehydrogenase-like Zn-dependent dehydrogenase